MNIETKLQRFSDTVRKEAEAFNDSKLGQLDNKYKENVAEFEKKVIAKYNDMAEDVSVQAEKLKNKKIAEANSAVKKQLIQRRVDYIKQVFDNVQIKLEEYFKTAEYEQSIVDHIDSYKGMSEAITVQIMERDKRLSQSIAGRCGVKVVTVDEDFLGGVRIILDKNRIADCTMRSKFENEKARFNKIQIL